MSANAPSNHHSVDGQRQFETLLNHLDALIYVADMETYEILFINEYGKQAWGDITGETCWRSLREGLDGPCPFCTNCLLLDENGAPTGVHKWEFQNAQTKRVYSIQDRAIPWGDDGRLVRMEIAVDVTEMKNVERALHENRERLQVALSAASIGTWRWDPKTNLDSRDAELNRILGLKPETSEQPVEDFVDRVHPDDRAMVDEALKQAVRDHTTYRVENRIVRPDGDIRWVRDQGRAYYASDDEVEFVTGAVMDITEARAKDENLRQFRLALDNSADAIFIIDRESTRFIDLNASAVEQLGYSREELLEMGPLDIVPELSRETMEGVLDDALRSNPPLGGLETTHRRKDGSTYPIEVFLRGMTTNDGRRLIIASARDISLREESDKLTEANQRLENEARRREQVEKELRSEKERAESANRYKSKFLANMSHEIRTPMNSILGFTEILEDSINDPKARGYLTAVKTAGNTLLDLINDILDLSKIEAGRMEVEYAPVDIEAMARDMITLFAEKAAKKDLELRFEHDPNQPKALMLDETKTRQILINLLGNAIKFTESGWIALKLKRLLRPDDGTVDLSIAVQDTGVGIPKDQIDRVFGVFEQRDGQSHSVYGGTGLGLAIVKRLAELMGGSVDAQSEAGWGSVFKVTFTGLTEAQDFESEKNADSSIDITSLRFEPATVMVVDDNAPNRHLIKSYLDLPGLSIIEAANGRECMDMIVENTPDLILMDLKMPEMDGFTATEAIKRDPRFKSLPIIAVTASVLLDEKRRAPLKCDDVLNKPVSRRDLVSMIVNYLKLADAPKAKNAQPLNEDATETPVSELRTPPIKRVGELLKRIEDDFQPIWEKRQTLAVDDVVDLGNLAFDWGTEHRFQPLADWGDGLRRFAESFAIDAMNAELEKWPDMLESIASKKRKKEAENHD